MNRLRRLFAKYREAILYLIFGGLTTVVSIASFALCTDGLHIDPLISNVISWILAVTFAYVTNRRWVFNSREQRAAGRIREAFAFYAGRLATLGLEEAILWLGIHALHWNHLFVKGFAQLIIILTNYVISKKIVFNC